ncbi:M14 family metallopeptidase [Reyranella massiliensis]|uniref:M14 family metallopeptidase n=1 Tax=Reyranella massiliensis TaxID=445220 RepID=UPI00030E543A|nr:M14 family metallopeptidase [Reyranella massiliensis]
MSATFFSATYREARQRFLEAARKAGAAVDAHVHPLTGAEGEEIGTDTALLGAADADKLFIVSSGTHGPEGFSGSACQLALLNDELACRATDRGIALLLIHAVNPFGFSHLKRTNEDNIDLNRNFNDFSTPYPDNPVYEEIHDLLVPAAWPPSAENENQLAAAMARLVGRRAPGISSGQARHPDGLFYSGTGPAWSNRTIRRIVRKHGANCRHIAWIDVHTGLGPYGHGEKIFGHHSDATLARALAWWGSDLIVSTATESVSPRTTGHITGCAPEECPGVAITPSTLEYGTLPSPQVRRALRGEAWLAGHPDAPAAVSAEIRRAVRDAFYVDADDWKGMILGQFRAFALQTINGLAAEQ